MTSYILTDRIRQVETVRDNARHSKEIAQQQINAILDAAQRAGRSNLTQEEDREVTRLIEAKDASVIEARNAGRDLEQLRAVQLEEIEYGKRVNQITPTNVRKPAYDRVARIGMEERTYRPDQDPNGRNFLTDVSRQFLFGDPGAQERLARHMREEQTERGEYLSRAVGTGAFTGLTVPQYMTELFAPATAALRPFADAACNRHPLPAQGMSINISRITTASSAALQSAENAAVSETNMDDTLLTVPVQTAAGQQTVSRQAIERGTGIDDVTMQDLFDRVATTLDSTLLNQATTGLTNVASATAYTDASPTAAELWPKIQGAASTVEATLLNMGYATHAVMHSRRWNWLASQVGSSWPFVSTSGMPVNAGGLTLTNEYGPAVRAKLSSGLLVVVDNNIATNLGGGTEDEIYVVPRNECHLWEDPAAPMFIRAEQPAAASLGVLLVAYSYFGYTFQRYASGAMAKVGGTGLIAPTF
ncbi:phage major capsid protein [Streptomyces sp. MNU76]|uniref:phage major capsid protein n=1 Tax=Streptomyces sp. MNU76 TaxID=2560026 RepID=UPI001E48EBB4|nr:phage major capsid protein [Streptomyces sp. MNU76]MCC9704327.1 phage major capsid protein [Streptomyces sp. MNU76]